MNRILMPGDVVIYHGKIEQIKGVTEKRVSFESKVGWNDLDDCAPILLTNAMLERNGWKCKTDRCKDWPTLSGIRRWHPARMEHQFVIAEFCTGNYGLLVGNRFRTIHTVNQLRMALKVCALDELADGFVVRMEDMA